MDLSKLNSGVVSEIDIDTETIISKETYENTDIITLSPVKVQGKIYKNNQDENVIDMHATGTMTIPDTISLEPIDYPFSIELTEEPLEIDQNDQNTLDFEAFLWQNIVLEIPLKFTKVKDYSEFQGTGWKLLNEDELKESQNPFNDLLSKFGGE